MERNIIDILNAKGIEPKCTICGYDILRTSPMSIEEKTYLLVKCTKCHHIMWFDAKALGLD